MHFERRMKMIAKKYKLRVIVTACSLALASMSGYAAAQSATSQGDEASKTRNATASNQKAGSSSKNSDTKDVAQQLNQATKLVKQMEREEGMKKVLEQAQGIFIVPDYKHATGADAGSAEGLMVVKQKGQWTTPAFYSIGAAKSGAQPDAEPGALVMVLNNDKALDRFMQDNSWNLDQKSGLNIANWSEKTKDSAGKSDVVVWSDKKGALGDMPFNVSDIKYDDRTTASFYGKQVAQQDVFGKWMEPPPQASSLIQALPGGSSMTSSGRSSSASGGAAKASPDSSSAGSSRSSGGASAMGGSAGGSTSGSTGSPSSSNSSSSTGSSSGSSTK
jgi:lipid-binding SYLF domain-containing protein